MPSCGTTNISAEPAVRLHEITEQLDGRFESACSADLSEQLARVGRDIRTLVGSACLLQPLAQPPDCHAYETGGGTATTELPACATPTSTECWRLVADPQQCLLPPNLRFEVARSAAPAPDTVVSLRCRT